MDELLAFTRACLDREEQHAQKDLWALDRATALGQWKAHYGVNLGYSEIWAEDRIVLRVETPRHEADALAIARFVKAGRKRAQDTLARIDSDRQILALHDHEHGRGLDELPIPGARLALTRVVQLMAQRYAGWDGWREVWRA